MRNTVRLDHRRILGVIGLCAALLAFAPAACAADVEEPDDETIYSWTTAERVRRFEDAVAAYDRQDYGKAFELWLPLAQMGDLAAQRNVGHLLRRGQGTAADPERAASFYRRAAERGLPGAQANLGMMYLDGEGVSKDPVEAVTWLRLAAEAGHSDAQYELARLAESGVGMPVTPSYARRLYQAAAAQGHAMAAVRLREMTDGDLPGTATPGEALAPPEGEMVPRIEEEHPRPQ